MMENKQNEKGLPCDAAPTEETPPTPVMGWKEQQYEKLRGKISVRALDFIIVLLILAFVGTIVLGLLNK